jgi:DNA replication protein DnaC
MTLMTTDGEFRERARKLGLYGLLANWEDAADESWLGQLIEWEEQERRRRSLERRLRTARIGRFKPMADFDWTWPRQIDRAAIDELFTLRFIEEAANAVLVGSNGVGKSMIARNVAHHALMRGFTVRFTTASAMLNDLGSQDGASSFKRRLRHYCSPQLLVVDEVGYLSYDTRYADLLFEVVSQRYLLRPLLITTNKVFGEWGEVFPNASCVVSLIDRLLHRSEVIAIDAESYRLKEATERAAHKARRRGRKKHAGAKELSPISAD